MREGVDPDALIAAADGLGVGAQPQKSGPLRFERLLVGLLPYLTVNETRAAAGYGPIAGGDVVTPEWIARCGGASPPPTDE